MTREEVKEKIEKISFPVQENIQFFLDTDDQVESFILVSAGSFIIQELDEVAEIFSTNLIDSINEGCSSCGFGAEIEVTLKR